MHNSTCHDISSTVKETEEAMGMTFPTNLSRFIELADMAADRIEETIYDGNIEQASHWQMLAHGLILTALEPLRS